MALRKAVNGRVLDFTASEVVSANRVTPVHAPGGYLHAAVVTPDNDTDLAQPATALWVGGAGDISLDTLDGGTVLIASIPAGTLLPIACARVRATSTDATAIVALY